MATNNKPSILAPHIRNIHAYRTFTDDLANPEKIISRTNLLDTDEDPKEILEVIRQQHKSLSTEIDKESGKIPLQKFGKYEKIESRPFHVRADSEVQFEPSMLSSYLGALSTDCPDLTIGQVKASDFYSYYWAQKAKSSSSTFGLFYPLGQYPNQLPNETPSGIWSEETGAWFLGKLTVPPKQFWFDPFDMVAYAGVFQFTLPAPKCDSLLYWGTKGQARAVSWQATGDPGWIDTDWVLFESPEGAIFPRDIQAFTFFADGLMLDSDGNSTTSETETWNRSFEVKAGVQSRIYIGLSFMLFGRNCELEIPGVQSYFNFDYGITYIMTPLPK